MKRANSQGPTGYFSSFGFRVLATCPLFEIFFENETFALFILCFGTISEKSKKVRKKLKKKIIFLIFLRGRFFNCFQIGSIVESQKGKYLIWILGMNFCGKWSVKISYSCSLKKISYHIGVHASTNQKLDFKIFRINNFLNRF